MNGRNHHRLPGIGLPVKSEQKPDNEHPTATNLRGMLEINGALQLPVVLGTDLKNEPIVLDLADAPHILIGGSDTNGINAGMNSIILSLLFRFRPDDLKFIMLDCKAPIFKVFRRLPHLLTPVIGEQKHTSAVLRRVVNELERRYRILARSHTKTLSEFNRRPVTEPVYDTDGVEIPPSLPYLVVFIGELAELMTGKDKEDIETKLCTIALKGRAAGIHLVIGTMHPSRENLSGFLEALLPTRICFKTESAAESLLILDRAGAEKLVGGGDLLFSSLGRGFVRVKSAFVPDRDVSKIVESACHQANLSFTMPVQTKQKRKQRGAV